MSGGAINETSAGLSMHQKPQKIRRRVFEAGHDQGEEDSMILLNELG